MDVSLLSPDRVVFGPQQPADAIEQFGRRSDRSVRGEHKRHYLKAARAWTSQIAPELDISAYLHNCPRGKPVAEATKPAVPAEEIIPPLPPAGLHGFIA